uniref:MADF domain-containing protein n=1 Tax=Amphimedon queenslandica TaxID=400682 RepID=A0A1X7UQP5_AMPQE
MADEALIEAVRLFSCLWQTGFKEYKDIKAKENAWKEVATKISGKNDKSRKDCIRRWKNIRDRFVREFKKTNRPTGTEGLPYKPN